MRRFNPEKELRKIQHGNKNKILYGIIVLLLIISIGSTYALYQVRYNKRIIYTKVAPFSTSDLDLAVYVNGVKQNIVPEKDSGYTFVALLCDDGFIQSTWDEEKWELELSSTIPIPNKCNAYFINEDYEDYEGYTIFEYNGNDGSDGNVQEYTVLKDGLYKLEVWGAQGGTGNTYAGGLGGYSSGYIELHSGEKLYVYVGGTGQTASTGTCIDGGYNGGGKACARLWLSYTYFQGSGGGATHIATENGLLKELIDNKESILIVAGGGGGGGFGYGGNSNSSVTNAGGGGGYFGGGIGTDGESCGGGGSGYLNPVLFSASTENGIQTGNGKAKITYIG